MVQRRQRRQAAAPAAPAPSAVMEIEHIHRRDLVPYQNNPRNNEKAIAAVKNSIKEFGFRVPLVIDENNVIVAGHTRFAATEGMYDVLPCTRMIGLTQAQINAFRIVDNRVAEIAEWDTELLGGEVALLLDAGVSLTEFGFSQEELDCLSDIVDDQCLEASSIVREAERDVARHTERRTPTTSRYVLGEFVFFTSVEVYQEWANALRSSCGFDSDRIEAELRRRLGL